MSYILFSWNFSLRFKYLLGSPISYYWEYVINKDIFLNLLCNLKSDWSLVPGHFCFWSFACYLRVMAILGYLPKLKRSQGVSFGAHFLHGFSYVILYLWITFQCHTFCSSQDIKQNVLLNSHLDNWSRQKLQDLFSIII